MTKSSSWNDPDDILDVVVELLEEYGYDGWALREVAERAHASLATVYKHFPSREDLIVSAVERWMDEYVYLPIREPLADQSLFEVIADVFRTMLEPWKGHPRMLQVFVRACDNPDGRDRLRAQGLSAIEPIRGLYHALDPTWAEDLNLILGDVFEGELRKFVNGEIGVSDIQRDIDGFCTGWSRS